MHKQGQRQVLKLRALSARLQSCASSPFLHIQWGMEDPASLPSQVFQACSEDAFPTGPLGDIGVDESLTDESQIGLGLREVPNHLSHPKQQNLGHIQLQDIWYQGTSLAKPRLTKTHGSKNCLFCLIYNSQNCLSLWSLLEGLSIDQSFPKERFYLAFCPGGPFQSILYMLFLIY